MNNVSLTYFVNFVLKAGTPRITVVKEFKGRDVYDPQTDFYKMLRERVIETFRSGQPIGSLESWASSVHEKKRAAYLAVITGLKRFVGRRAHEWFEPPRENFTLGGIPLNVNPELGLMIEGVPHIIKLYLKDDPPLVKNRTQLILRILETALSATSPGCTFAVLDARKGRLHASGSSPSSIDALLAGEAAAFKVMYDTV
ncbi:hypothetical protein [Pendulispora albinea]|uniref:Uncharacterized protein n=1 Tax=Pendulispora albinea TaxID=2741071 RepID=A0ABZ2LV74_9BACT